MPLTVVDSVDELFIDDMYHVYMWTWPNHCQSHYIFGRLKENLNILSLESLISAYTRGWNTGLSHANLLAVLRKSTDLSWLKNPLLHTSHNSGKFKSGKWTCYPYESTIVVLNASPQDASNCPLSFKYDNINSIPNTSEPLFVHFPELVHHHVPM